MFAGSPLLVASLKGWQHLGAGLRGGHHQGQAGYLCYPHHAVMTQAQWAAAPWVFLGCCTWVDHSSPGGGDQAAPGLCSLGLDGNQACPAAVVSPGCSPSILLRALAVRTFSVLCIKYCSKCNVCWSYGLQLSIHGLCYSR